MAGTAEGRMAGLPSYGGAAIGDQALRVARACQLARPGTSPPENERYRAGQPSNSGPPAPTRAFTPFRGGDQRVRV